MGGREKVIFYASGILLALGLVFIFQTKDIGKAKIVFCDIGQGDGMLIVSPEGKQIVFDGGPGTKIVDCLSKNMPFWDRTIEMVVLSHPQKDHMEGLVDVLEKYKVENVVTTGITNDTKIFETWKNDIENEGAKIYKPKAGDKILPDAGSNFELDVLWPSEEKYKDWEVSVPSDLNDSSVVLMVSYGSFCAYLTGDLPKEFLENITGRECQVLKVSHHGSRTGTNEKILDAIRPEYAVIQVGKNNRFGHPHKEIMKMLEDRGIKVFRNDVEGDITLEFGQDSYKVF